MWQTISVRETCERLKTNSVNGLTKDEAEERIKKYGENKLTEKKKESILVKFLKQFNDFLAKRLKEKAWTMSKVQDKDVRIYKEFISLSKKECSK